MRAYVFWSEGEFDGIKVSAPCTLMIANGKLAVSDPTQKRFELLVTVNDREYRFVTEQTFGKTLFADLI